MLETIDWIVIVGFLVIIIGVGISFTNKAGGNLTNFFLGGRNLPWYMAGISMVATTFAADTPLAVTELVGVNGISGNWLWWNLLAGGMLTTFFFAAMWRRANIVTEIEFIELRYSGKPAAALRGFKAIYMGLVMNVLIIGWVNLAMMTILEGFFGMDHETAFSYMAIGMLLVAIYSSMSGLLGVVITDIIQFVIAIGGSIVLAIFVINSEQVGGIVHLKEALPPNTLNFLPEIGTTSTTDSLAITGASFLAFFGFMWWASWYPGAEPGGGGYIAQRMMSTKNEKQAIYATLFFQIAHYCLRPWPWILVGLSAIVIYSVPANIQNNALKAEVEQLKTELHLSDESFGLTRFELQEKYADNTLVLHNLDHLSDVNNRLKAEGGKGLTEALSYAKDKRFGYVYAMKNFLPQGLIGLLLVSFFAAYMSTISTQLNWGASYLVNDVYYRFVNTEATQSALVNVSRIVTLILMAVGLVVSLFITSISGVWQFIMECGAGLGLVLILRWYWWRINAWSEIVATLAPFVGYALAKFVFDLVFPYSFFVTVGFTTVAWVAATFVTKPTAASTLHDFYRKIKPDGFWKPIQLELNESDRKSNTKYLLACWLSAVVMTYGILFALGKIILLEPFEAIFSGVFAILGFVLLKYFMKKTRIFSDVA